MKTSILAAAVSGTVVISDPADAGARRGSAAAARFGLIASSPLDRCRGKS
jgi:hypothetical protein